MPTRAIRWWTAAERQRMAEALPLMCAAWTAEWDIAVSPLCACSALDSVASAWRERSWRSLGSLDGTGSGQVWVPGSAGDWPNLVSLWRGAETVTSDTGRSGGAMAQAVTSLAWQAWRDVLGERLGVSGGTAGDTLDAAIWRSGSGALAVSFAFGHQAVDIICDAPVAAAFLGYPAGMSTSAPTAARALTPLLSIIEARTVRLRLDLQPVDLDLGTLCSLAPGDVVRLTHNLDQPVLVNDEDNTTVARGFLVSAETRKAVQLCPPT